MNRDDNPTPADIKKAYRSAAKTLHPDRQGNKDDFQKLNNCHELLADPSMKRLWDQLVDRD